MAQKPERPRKSHVGNAFVVKLLCKRAMPIVRYGFSSYQGSNAVAARLKACLCNYVLARQQTDVEILVGCPSFDSLTDHINNLAKDQHSVVRNFGNENLLDDRLRCQGSADDLNYGAIPRIHSLLLGLD